MILDTQFLGMLVEQGTAAREKATELDASGLPMRIPTVVAWELYYGIGKIDGEEATVGLQRSYRRLLQSLSVVDLNDRTARRAGILRGKHVASDSLATLDGADSVVAAHGLVYNEPVVSNDSDLQAVDGLQVETF